jgi:plasmid maintenance system antidote protein VapI
VTIHPGEMLLEEFMLLLAISRTRNEFGKQIE